MRQIDTRTQQLFKDPLKRRAWVKYQIQLQGRSMSEVAAGAGVDRRTLYQTFLRPYPRMEKVIADAVDLSPQVLFPERYDNDGLPCRPMGRPRKSTVKTIQNTTARTGRNVQDDASDRRRGERRQDQRRRA